MKKKMLIGSLLLSSSLFLSGCGSLNTQAANAQATSGSQVKYYFTRALQHPDQALKAQINSAKSTLDIAIYSLTKKDIVDAIISAQKRGVQTRIITDRSESENKAETAQLQRLKKAGITIKENTHPGLMHLKVSIIDDAVVTTGSYNYSQAASTENDEVLVVIQDPGMAAKWDDEFQKMWDDTKNYSTL